MDKFKLEGRVSIVGKNTSGKIAFIGKTHFSEGEWFGIILDEAKGRNNGCVDGKRYFKCPRNHGIFVRRCQLQGEILEPRRSCCSIKNFYPNYLRNYVSVKPKISLPQNKKKTGRELEAKTSDHVLNQMDSFREDRETIDSEEFEIISQLEDQREKVEGAKLKTKESELPNDICEKTARENDLQKELARAEKNIAILKRKLHKAERRYKVSEKKRLKLNVKMEELREITENVIIEKEMAEEKSEYFELMLKDKTDECASLEIEMDILKEEMKLQTIDGNPAVHYVKTLENENKILNSALVKLRDLYQDLQKQLDDFKKTIEKNLKEIECRKIIEKSLEDKICKHEEDISELCDFIDSVSNADEIVFEVSERNSKLQTKIKYLYEELLCMVDQLEVREEIEETLQELKLMDREEIQVLESKVRCLRLALNQSRFILKDREEVMKKYRDLTAFLREKNNKLSEELEIVRREKKEAVLEAENLKLKNHRERRKSLKNSVAEENMKFDLESYKTELILLSSFMPENFFMRGAENSSIQVKLISTKMIKKLELLICIVQSQYCDYNNLQWENLKSLSEQTTFLITACKLQGFFKIFNESFDCMDAKNFLTFGKHYDILIQTNKILDDYFSFIAENEFDCKDYMENMKNAYCSLFKILITNYAPKSREIILHSETFLKMIHLSCKCVSAFSIAIKASDNLSPESKDSVQKIINKTKNLNINVDCTFNVVQNCKKENLCLLPIVKDKIELCSDAIQELMEYVISSYRRVNEKKQKLWESKEQINVSLIEINNKLTEIVTNMHELRRNINSGEFFAECTVRPRFSSTYLWAESKKQETKNVISRLNKEITSCEKEIFNLTRIILVQRKKECQQIRKKLLQDASQQTEELTQEEQEEFVDDHDNSAMIEYLNWKLQDMECSMKYLWQQNTELMIARMKIQQKSLQPLTLMRKTRYEVDTHNIFELQKRLNNAAVSLRSIILPTIVDVTRRKSLNERKYKKYLLERKLVQQGIKNELRDIVVEIKRLKSSQPYVWS